MSETRRGFWRVNFEIEVDGKHVQLGDLEELQREVILEQIADGNTSGEIYIDEEETDELEQEQREAEEYKTMKRCQDEQWKY